MVAAQKSTTVRTPSLEELAALFFKPRRPRPIAPPEGAVAGWWETPEGRLPGWSVGRGPMVLLVHGWEGQSGQLGGLALRLAARGYRAVAVDLPAHGGAPGESASALTFARALAAVAAAEGPLHGLVAHSLGGAASCLALAGGLAAGRVALLAPVAEPTPFARKLARYAGLTEAQEPALFRAIEARAGISFASLYAPDRVRALPAPLLVLHDPADAEVPFEHGQAIAAAAPRGRLEPAPGAGHAGVLSQPDVLDRVTNFLTDEVDHG